MQTALDRLSILLRGAAHTLMHEIGRRNRDIHNLTELQHDIFDRGRHKYRAYRIVASAGDIGQHYGIQGMNWSSPPILDNPSETRTLNGRRLRGKGSFGSLRHNNPPKVTNIAPRAT